MKKILLILAIIATGCTTQQRYLPLPDPNIYSIVDTQTGDVYYFSTEDNTWYKLPPISLAKPSPK